LADAVVVVKVVEGLRLWLLLLLLLLLLEQSGRSLETRALTERRRKSNFSKIWQDLFGVAQTKFTVIKSF
jgi:hypothetical protein